MITPTLMFSVLLVAILALAGAYVRGGQPASRV